MTVLVVARPIDQSGWSTLARSSGHIDGSVAIFDRPPIVNATAAHLTRTVADNAESVRCCHRLLSAMRRVWSTWPGAGVVVVG